MIEKLNKDTIILIEFKEFDNPRWDIKAQKKYQYEIVISLAEDINDSREVFKRFTKKEKFESVKTAIINEIRDNAGFHQPKTYRQEQISFSEPDNGLTKTIIGTVLLDELADFSIGHSN